MARGFRIGYPSPGSRIITCDLGSYALNGQVAALIGSGGSDNPSGYPTSGTEYFSFAYDTSSTTGVQQPSNLCVIRGFNASGGPDGGGYWGMYPRPQSNPDADGDNCGWSAGTTPCPVDDCPRMFIDFRLLLTQDLLDEICNAQFDTNDFWRRGNKVLDTQQWNVSGTGPDTSEGRRWVAKLLRDRDNVNDPPRWALLSGGAGRDFFGDGSLPLVDLRNYADVWCWVCFVLDGPNEVFEVYMKKAGDPGVTLVLRRDPSSDNGDDPALDYNGRGWHSLQNAIFGFAQDMTGAAEGPTIHWGIRNVRRSNFWQGPPVF